MLKANGKYTALEILEALGVEKFPVEDKSYIARNVFGKCAIGIGGLPVVQPHHMISIPAGTEKLSVHVGLEVYELDLDGDAEERVLSEGVKKHQEANRPVNKLSEAEKEEK